MIELKKDKYGWIDWRSSIPSEFLFPNKYNFEARGQEVPKSIEGLDESDIVIGLAGIKFIARCRGYKRVDFRVIYQDQENVAVRCEIEWIPNDENPNGVIYSEIASCSVKNSNDFGMKYCEAIACNRAFSRCVRNFLNIHIVAEEEISSSGTESKSNGSSVDNKANSITPQAILEKICKDKSLSLKDMLEKFYDELDKDEITKNTNSFTELSTKIAKKMLKKVKSV